ncbi:MAG: J domain-containing protein [Actinobacteria bacterium]|nr:J domain-containing protein [Actinomycetota bacterium]
MRREWLEKDYYQTLGVDPGASDKEIKQAYRRLAQQYHPDNNPGDADAEAKFKEVSEAYGTLSHAEDRKQYDAARDAVRRGTFTGGPGGGAQYVRIDDLGDLGDLFGGGMFGGLGDLFGFSGRTGRPAPQRGGDREAEVSLTFHEAVSGATKAIEADGRRVTVKIPPGVEDGARIRVRGKGWPGGAGGPAGDLYVRVHAARHPIFDRSGADLRVEVPVSYTEAALGADVTAPTLDGKVTLRIPPGTPSGKTFRVKGRGIATPKRTGDLLVTVEVQVPDHLDDDARALLERLRDLEAPRNPRAHLGV